MQLSYRGLSYEFNAPGVKATEATQLGLFLGNSYSMRHHNVTDRHLGASQLKYRGVKYES